MTRSTHSVIGKKVPQENGNHSQSDRGEQSESAKNNGQESHEAHALRKPIQFDPNGAVMAAITHALRSDGVRLALSAFIEGRQLKGSWNLRIEGAVLVPVEPENNEPGK